MRREQISHGISVVIGGGVQGAVARDEVIAERELCVPGGSALDDVGVARDQGLFAGADEVARFSHVIATRHLAVRK